MDGKLTYAASTVLAVLALALLIANVAMISSNRTLQDSANQRQADINKAATLATLNQNLVQALAQAAVTNNDSAIKELLASQGITLNPKALPAAASSAAADAEKKAAPKK